MILHAHMLERVWKWWMDTHWHRDAKPEPARPGSFRRACIGLCWRGTSELSLTRRVLCRGRTAASTPALRTGWATLSRQKWWSCRMTRVPTPPRWSVASTQWCSHFATYPAWRADISLRNPPCSQTEAPRRWNRTRRLKNKGCTERKSNYRGPFFSSLAPPLLSASWRNCGCAVKATRSGGAASDDALRCKLMSRLGPSGLWMLSRRSGDVPLHWCSHLQRFRYLTVNYVF